LALIGPSTVACSIGSGLKLPDPGDEDGARGSFLPLPREAHRPQKYRRADHYIIGNFKPLALRQIHAAGNTLAGVNAVCRVFSLVPALAGMAFFSAALLGH
jgi:hypothetical protein